MDISLMYVESEAKGTGTVAPVHKDQYRKQKGINVQPHDVELLQVDIAQARLDSQTCVEDYLH